MKIYEPESEIAKRFSTDTLNFALCFKESAEISLKCDFGKIFSFRINKKVPNMWKKKKEPAF